MHQQPLQNWTGPARGSGGKAAASDPCVLRAGDSKTAVRSRPGLPNFLVVGAAKAGTTSLYHYLKEHPDIFMSRIKEPSFVSAQFLKIPQRGFRRDRKIYVSNFTDYCSLFEDSAGYGAIGEASPENLYFHEKAIGYITHFLGSPKIIMILRDPTERAFSAYMFLMRDNREYLSFEEALNQEEKRRKENWKFIWFYRDVGFYYRQVKAYAEKFGDVKVCLYDDLQRDAVSLVKGIYDFLGVDASYTPNARIRHNVSGIPRSRVLNNFFIEPSRLQSITRSVGKSILKEDSWVRLRERLRAKLLAKSEMKPETRQFLQHTYREDILRLQDLIRRDLSSWLSGCD